MEKIYAAANAASRIYSASWRRGNIIRAQTRLKDRSLTRRLVDFYLDSLETEVSYLLTESQRDAA
ncbi:hypothetical protein [Bradyrhizobium ottawaense]|uniref:hypothetical protein n=1 Tax=Bradyrhizobium ottawaense TaxID=931866 RepID=UPI000B8503CE|nr:hypothetical protein [Bradyrhizobium ottawaense]